MDIASVLAKVGISHKAAQVYLTALQMGPSTMTEIAKAAEYKRPTTYLLIDELLMRGFMSTVKKGKKTHYVTEHPKRIQQALQNQMREMERMMPELEALYYEPKDKPRIKVYEGTQAMMQVYDEMYNHISEKGEALFFTAIGDLMDQIPDAITGFFKLISAAQSQYRVRELNLGDARGQQYVQTTKKFRGKNHLVRSLSPEKFLFKNTDTLIFENKVCMFSFKKDVFTIVIENQQIADTYRAMFNAAWETGEEIR